jgi:hypothetical protein
VCAITPPAHYYSFPAYAGPKFASANSLVSASEASPLRSRMRGKGRAISFPAYAGPNAVGVKSVSASGASSFGCGLGQGELSSLTLGLL